MKSVSGERDVKLFGPDQVKFPFETGAAA